MTTEAQTVCLVVGGLIGMGAEIYGVFDTYAQAEAAIKVHDPTDRFQCYIEEVDRNRWFEIPLEV